VKTRTFLFGGLALLLLIALVGVLFLGARKPAMNPLVVSVTQTNVLPRLFPSVGGVLLILPDGSLWSWGQAGGLRFPRVRVPRRFDGDTNWAAAFAANNHGVGIRTDGTIWEWGWSAARFSPAPERVDPGSNWVSITAGDAHTVALRNDGTLWGRGYNTSGQLGTGSTIVESNWVQIGQDRDWAAVRCGQGSYTYALKRDGSFWVWGQMGMVSPQPCDIATPTQACMETNWIELTTGPGVYLRNQAGDLWYPLWKPPDPKAPANATCSLLATNTAPGRFALAFCGVPKFCEIRSDGTLWEAPVTYSRSHPGDVLHVRIGAWDRVGKRSDWVWIGGSGTALGVTADGTVWFWGNDVGQEPVLDFESRIKTLRAEVLKWFGFTPAGVMTSVHQSYEKEPRPLLRVIPANAPERRP
jgi:alpha-tubulin suppressor-like RCC1 family protein